MKQHITIMLLTSVALLAGQGRGQADNVSLDAARQAATTVINKSRQHPGSQQSPATRTLTLAHTEASSVDDQAAAYYAFNVGNDEGFVIIAGEDRAVQVLGYSDSGHLDWNNLPCNLEAWLERYKEQIEWLQAHPNAQTHRIPRLESEATDTSVEPLLTTQWGQSKPYNDNCPVYDGERCVTGCVATAMAQIMNYYNYPTEPTPSLPAYLTDDEAYRVDSLPPITMAWSKMLDTYDEDEYTASQGAAVAELMRYCGQSVKMMYGSDTDGSAAYSEDVPKALMRTGYYCKEDLLERTPQVSTEEWNQYLNAELDLYRPVYYSAASSKGGHAFVLDGYHYDEELGCYTYHINWGWSGYGNGYFPSDAMTVITTDGTDNISFSTGHKILQTVQPPSFNMVTMRSLEVNPTLVAIDETMNLTADWVRYKLYEAGGQLTFVMSNAAGEAVGYCGEELTPNRTGTLQTMTAQAEFPQWLESGTYQLQLFHIGTDETTRTAARGDALNVRITGNVVKAGEPFTIGDVNQVVNRILTNEQSTWSISDVNAVVNQIVTNE